MSLIKFLFFSLFFVGTAFSQLPEFQHKEIHLFHHHHHQRETWLEMAYASAEIKNPEKWTSDSRKKKIKEIDIVFSRYPLDKKDWKTNYDSLLSKRVKSIVALIPQVLSDSGVVWNLVFQTAARSDAQARKLPHGVLVRYELKPTDKMRQNMRVVGKILNGELDADSVVISVMNRKKWSNSVIVNDWTGSMYTYGAQAVLWHKLNLRDSAKRYFVFFNDGDHQLDEQKVIGKTGGFYPVETSQIKDIIATMREVMLNGYGGDLEENDAEAILYAIDKFGNQVEHVILLADNNGGIKDRVLIPKINRPVRVIVCSVLKEDPIHPDYIELAYRTKGSIHTLSQDIEDLAKLQENQEFSIGNNLYKIQNGKVILLR
jgi:hypothetical protein